MDYGSGPSTGIKQSQTSFSQTQLRDIVQDRHVEIIEVKRTLGRPVIGQAIAGRDLFERDYDPNTTEPVVVCGEGDPALEWVCRRNGVRVEIVESEELDRNPAASSKSFRDLESR